MTLETGYSALSRLPSLPLDTLKIDRTFVANKNWEICEVILSLTNKLGLNVIVEGVETREEVAVLQKIGFQHMQGYFFSHPLKAEAASSLLAHSFAPLAQKQGPTHTPPAEILLAS